MIRISVVIPSWQRPQLLQNCLQALGRQTLMPSEYEVVVVSDGPDEITEKALEQWLQSDPEHHRFTPMPQKKGPAAARNYGWQRAKAPLVAFTDDDTLPDANWLQAYLDGWDGSELAAFTGKVIVPLTALPSDFARNTAGLETADFVTANCACTAKALQMVGGFDERFAMAWREDSDLHFKLLQQHVPLIKKSAAIVVHPVRAARWGVSIKEQKKTLYNALLYKKFPALYRQYDNSRPPLLYYVIVFSLLLCVISYLEVWKIACVTGLLIWLMSTLWFTYKRLKNNSHSFRHVTEMLYTSALIPWLSLYWHFYGLIKYKTWFL